MSFKPVIGINGEFRAAKKDVVPLSWYNTGYYDSVVAAGGLPVLLPPLAEDRDLKQFLKMLDGLVIWRLSARPGSGAIGDGTTSGDPVDAPAARGF